MADEPSGRVFRAALAGESSGRDALAGMLKERFDESAVAIVRRLNDAEFVEFRPAEAERLLEDWTEGQLFDPKSEVRWRQADDGYDVLLLTESNDLPMGFRELRDSPFTVVEPSSKETHGFLLWGTTHDRDGWLETRIPRYLRYPVETKGSLRLSYLLYERGAVTCWVRLRNLREVR